jgi:hypothetical protein
MNAGMLTESADMGCAVWTSFLSVLMEQGARWEPVAVGFGIGHVQPLVQLLLHQPWQLVLSSSLLVFCVPPTYIPILSLLILFLQRLEEPTQYRWEKNSCGVALL